jgi:hypothetical protein
MALDERRRRLRAKFLGTRGPCWPTSARARHGGQISNRVVDALGDIAGACG